MTRALGDAQPPDSSVSLDYFTGLYLAKEDPWDLATKWHDQRKYAITVASLPKRHYRRCYEPGASVGLLTRLLAERCDEILAVDCVPEAVRTAEENLRDLPHVRVEEAMLPAELPDGTFDLILVGDLFYYLSAEDFDELVDGLLARLESGGDLVSVHFRDRENPGNYDGFNVHEKLAGKPGITRIVHHEDEWFVLDVFRANDER
ncbi:class I SAM-dependent methyltransferase [Paractinoplanes durhamensis]|uniref:Methyltransferase n=1 Tax=Paractinoplanes durhamensis TaxID=113563 RepID=A0ABQ3ZDS9_9ACTN|nr:class I SAM-dependent methyltransferase [Actinoplanes durhamensis]GIE07988.1 methyltransferase [Actinoplanes durhamensis]